MSNTVEYIIYWLWLSMRCSAGSKTYAILRKSFATPYDVYHADEQEIACALEGNSRDFKALCNKELSDVKKLLEYCVRTGIKLICYDSPEYPAALREIEDPPVLLYCLGEIPSSDEKLFVSVVGTRTMSDYGKRMAFEISSDLAIAGAVVVSGLALGIDGTAHAAAISSKGKTVAVLGNGVDSVYPPQHKRLAAFVANNGAVVSEFPPGSAPEKWNFPMRNRIISAMSSAVIVIEADEKSGALITGRKALEQGKKVYALPGNVDEPNSFGISMLIKEGAKPISCADDVLDDFNSIYDSKVNIFNLLKRSALAVDITLEKYGVQCRQKNPLKRKGNSLDKTRNHKNYKEDVHTGSKNEYNKTNQASKTIESEISIDVNSILSGLEPAIINVYNKIPEEREILIDNIVGESKMSDVMSAITMLEINGLVKILPGNMVKRT